MTATQPLLSFSSCGRVFVTRRQVGAGRQVKRVVQRAPGPEMPRDTFMRLIFQSMLNLQVVSVTALDRRTGNLVAAPAELVEQTPRQNAGGGDWIYETIVPTQWHWEYKDPDSGVVFEGPHPTDTGEEDFCTVTTTENGVCCTCQRSRATHNEVTGECAPCAHWAADFIRQLLEAAPPVPPETDVLQVLHDIHCFPATPGPYPLTALLSLYSLPLPRVTQFLQVALLMPEIAIVAPILAQQRFNAAIVLLYGGVLDANK